MNCVSASQHQCCPRSANLLKPITNGVDVEKLGGNFAKSDFVLCLGRICAEKGFHFALDAAKAADVKMVLAGEVSPNQLNLDYFETEIKPRLNHARTFVGPLGA